MIISLTLGRSGGRSTAYPYLINSSGSHILPSWYNNVSPIGLATSLANIQLWHSYQLHSRNRRLLLHFRYLLTTLHLNN